jgi:hypothetical protein
MTDGDHKPASTVLSHLCKPVCRHLCPAEWGTGYISWMDPSQQLPLLLLCVRRLLLLCFPSCRTCWLSWQAGLHTQGRQHASAAQLPYHWWQLLRITRGSSALEEITYVHVYEEHVLNCTCSSPCTPSSSYIPAEHRAYVTTPEQTT